MTLIEQVATYLQAQSVGTIATNLFFSFAPDIDSGDFVVTVIDTGGVQPDEYLPTKSPTFQVFIRAKDYATGKAKLDAVRTALHQFRNAYLVVGQTYIYFIYAQSEGGHLGKNPDNGKDEFSMNFIARTR